MSLTCKIAASHYVLPKKILTNEDLFERFGEKKVRGISKLSGISERRIADDDTTAVDLGFAAADRMLESENIDRGDFDALIFVSQTGDYILPPSASVLHERLGLPETCAAFDIPMGCAAMPYAFAVAKGLAASGQCRKILLVFSDTVTKLVNPKDRSLVTLHGDGAAAFALEACPCGEGLDFAELGTDSSGWRHLIVPAGGMRTPKSPETAVETEDENGIICSQENLQMNGPAVFHFSISKIPGEIKKALQKYSESIENYSMVLLHQANRMMLDQIYAQIGVSDSQKFFFMEKVGNLSTAASPVLLAEALRSGKLENGGRVLGAAFGVGLAWGTYSITFKAGSAKASKAPTEF